MARACPSLTTDGHPCKGNPLPGRPYCLAHDPESAEARAKGSRKGGEGKATARRVARQWAAMGEQMTAADLPPMLRAAILDVRAGRMEPSVAGAIATLAKTSVSIANEIEMEQRIARLEQAAGLVRPGTLRRVK